jgi:hypothetical protein
LVCVLLVLGWANGFRSVARPAALAAGVLLLAFGIRVLFFGRLQGTSPFTYVSTTIFSGRIGVVQDYLRSLLGDGVTAVVLVLAGVLVVGGLGLAIVLTVRLVRRRMSRSAVSAVALYYALVPVTGLVGTLVLLITDYLYLWPVLILPLILSLLPLPTRWIPWAASIAIGALVVAGAVTGGATNLARAPAYFSYRSPETRCLDQKLPAGVTVGYATFSDARRIELTSRRGIRLIQLKSSGVRAYWLTNRDYARDNVGQFFYINARGDEPAISVSYVERHFGRPDSSFRCAPGQRVLIYREPTELAKIKARYSTLPPPG